MQHVNLITPSLSLGCQTASSPIVGVLSLWMGWYGTFCKIWMNIFTILVWKSCSGAQLFRKNVMPITRRKNNLIKVERWALFIEIAPSKPLAPSICAHHLQRKKLLQNLGILLCTICPSPFERSEPNRKKITSAELLDSINPYTWGVKNEKKNYLRCTVFFKLKNCRKILYLQKHHYFRWISGKYFIFLIFDPSDIWVNRMQKLGGCDFF